MIRRLKNRVVSAFWGRHYRRGGHRTWMAEPAVRRAVNARITGDPHRWPMEWFRSSLDEPFERGLSLGCGEGRLERDVLAKGICREMVGLDLSPEAVARASESARAESCSEVEYRLGDMNRLELEENSFDIIFFHQSLHHVEALELCLTSVARALRPGGLLYLDEYIGPSRGDWNRALVAHAEASFDRLPTEVRRRRQLTLPIDWRDPSEAIRSAEIVPTLEQHFTIAERRDYGGNLLSVIHPLLEVEILDAARGEEVLERLIFEEDELLRGGEPSYYSVLLAQHRGESR